MSHGFLPCRPGNVVSHTLSALILLFRLCGIVPSQSCERLRSPSDKRQPCPLCGLLFCYPPPSIVATSSLSLYCTICKTLHTEPHLRFRTSYTQNQTFTCSYATTISLATMKLLAVLAPVAGLAAFGHAWKSESESESVIWTTEVVTAYTTICPVCTLFVHHVDHHLTSIAVSHHLGLQEHHVYRDLLHDYHPA